MSAGKTSVTLDESEAFLSLCALRFYMNANGSAPHLNAKNLETKLNEFLSGTPFVVGTAKNIASLLGARGGTKGGASTSEAKRTAAAANGAKGGRPRKPNLFIKFAKTFWYERDHKLINMLYRLVGKSVSAGEWLPDKADVRTGPYARIYIPEITPALEKLLNNSVNVLEWDTKPFLRLCTEHKNDSLRETMEDERLKAGSCCICGQPAKWIY